MKVTHVETIEVISQLPCLFEQPIAAHNLTIFLFDTSFFFIKELLWRALQSMMGCSATGDRI